MKIRQRHSKKARIEIIPMIDVIFFLLIFFMISSLAMTRIQSVPVSLPLTSNSPQAEKLPIVLSIQKDGAVFVNKVATPLESLRSQLAYVMRDRPQDVVLIHADQGVPYGRVVQVMDMARQLGVRKFALATEAASKNGK